MSENKEECILTQRTKEVLFENSSVDNTTLREVKSTTLRDYECVKAMFENVEKSIANTANNYWKIVDIWFNYVYGINDNRPYDKEMIIRKVFINNSEYIIVAYNQQLIELLEGVALSRNGYRRPVDYNRQLNLNVPMSTLPYRDIDQYNNMNNYLIYNKIPSYKRAWKICGAVTLCLGGLSLSPLLILIGGTITYLFRDSNTEMNKYLYNIKSRKYLSDINSPFENKKNIKLRESDRNLLPINQSLQHHLNSPQYSPQSQFQNYSSQYPPQSQPQTIINNYYYTYNYSTPPDNIKNEDLRGNDNVGNK